MAHAATGQAARAGLTIICAPTGAAARAVADDAMAALARDGVRATRILPTADAAKRERRRLADGGEAVLASGVGTLSAWAEGRWQVFGDGRRCVTPAQRRAHVIAAIRATQDAEAGGGLDLKARGLVACVEKAVRDGSGAPAFEHPTGEATRALNPAQQALLAICRAHERFLESAGLIEGGLAASLLPAAMGDFGWEHLVLQDACALSDAQVRLLAQVAVRAGVTLAVRANAPGAQEPSPSLALADAAVHALAQACAELGVPVSWQAAPAEPSPWASAEVAALARTLFRGGDGEVVAPAGDVRFVLPAGRYAEDEAVAREVACLVSGGTDPRDVVVTCPDPLAMARGMSGRLAAQRIGVLAAGTRPLSLTLPYRALVGLMQLVEAAEGADGAKPAAELRPLASDLARTGLLGVGAGEALRLDASWRQRRTTNARDMLEGLRTHRAYSEDAGTYVTEPTTADGVIARLQAGDALGALELLEPAGGGATSEQALQRSAFVTLRGLIEAATSAWGANARPTSADVALLAEGVCVLETCLSVPPQDIDAQRSARVLSIRPKAVRVMTLREAGGCDARAVIVCGLTAQGYSLAEPEDAVGHLFATLGLPAASGHADELRWQFACAVEAARDTLVLERTLNDEKAQPARPSALFEEVVDCYRPDVTASDDLDRATGLPKDGSLPCVTLGEEAFDELVSPVGPLDRARVRVDAPRFELGTEAARGLFPASGTLSPSSLEAYIRCPARWFFEHKLPTDKLDGEFGPKQRGTLCHRVLQTFHQQMPSHLGVARITPELLEQRAGDVDALLDACFDAAVREARETAEDPDARNQDVLNCLVAVSPLEERSVESRRVQLRDVVRAEALFPMGYAPVAAEWEFGPQRRRPDGGTAGPAVGPVPYAGVLLQGKIDRIDADAEGRALVVDYKGSISSFDVVSEDGIPLHSQAFMYARAVERGGLGLSPSGVAYFSYTSAGIVGQGDAHLTAALPTGRAEDAFYRRFGKTYSELDDAFAATLDAVEVCAAEAAERMRAGDISPEPRFGKNSCACCPIADTCPRRVS